jgi:DMSO reductase anchor subunit
MHPAFSVIFLTTLIGAGQGLFLALYTGESYAAVQLLPEQPHKFYVAGSIMSVVLLAGGLLASFFHLGHPERAWRAASQWRTSWLSREVIILPIVIGLVAAYGLLHFLGWEVDMLGLDNSFDGLLTLVVGAVAVVATFALFISTGMIYACIKFLQEWASPLTVINYTLLGTASGFTLATGFSDYFVPELRNFYGSWAIIITFTALVTRTASLIRNARIKQRSSLQTAIGVRHTRITQRSQGFMGGSFNTREFFHHVPAMLFRSFKWIFLLLTFVVPVGMIIWGMESGYTMVLLLAFAVQYAGLIMERWFFFAQANHPQNLYYQTVG